MFGWFMAKKKAEAPEVEVVEVVEVNVNPERDDEFYKRHPGALDGVIYE